MILLGEYERGIYMSEKLNDFIEAMTEVALSIQEKFDDFLLQVYEKFGDNDE